SIHPSSLIPHPSSLIDAMLFHLRGERARRDAEKLGGFVAGSGALQRLGDLDLLDAAYRTPGRFFQCSGEINCVAKPVVTAAGKIEILRLDPRAVAEDRRTFDAVLQFADVAGPGVLVQGLARRLTDLQARLVQLASEA